MHRVQQARARLRAAAAASNPHSFTHCITDVEAFPGLDVLIGTFQSQTRGAVHRAADGDRRLSQLTLAI